MPIRVQVALLTLLCLLIAAPAQAAQLWPLQTGQWMELDKQDNLGNKWTVRIDVYEEVSLDGKQYFRVVEQNYDPFTGDVLEEFYIRSTNTEVYSWNGPGLGETLGFKTGNVGDYWIYDGGDKRKEIVAIEPITIPYGGTYTAYQYKHYRLSDPTRYDLEWVVPGLGWVGEEDYWVNPDRVPVKAKLARAGQNPLFNLKTGTRLIYNSSDNTGQTWHMNMEVREQVTLNGKIYTHIYQTNYDPYQNDFEDDKYIRCTDKEVYKYNGNGEDIVFRAADKGTTWEYPANGGTVHTTIEDIIQMTVPFGGPFVAYVHRSFFMPPEGPFSPVWYDYVVPGEGLVKNVDNWLDVPGRAPVIHELAQKLRPHNLSPIITLLLE